MKEVVFSKRIKALREDNNLSMAQFAEEMGVTKSRVNMWENGNAIPKSDVLKKLANYFHVSIDYLLGNDITDNIRPENKELELLQRGLEKLDRNEMEKAKNMLKAVFSDIFEDDEEEDDGI